MSRTLQIIELLITEMERNLDRYKVELTSRGLCITELIRVKGTNACYFHFYEPIEDYEVECNKSFEEFIRGLKA